MAAADAADRALATGNGADKPLLGIPYALKDIFVTRALDDDGQPNGGLPTTAGSKILEGYRCAYASSAEERLTDAGAVLLGKTNLDEFAMGSSNENSAYGPVRNPWDEGLVPGGSSGGSAAAVASGQAFFATGTDTGGSIRQPASLSGIVGLKPTYGRVSRYGMVAFAQLARPVRPARPIGGRRRDRPAGARRARPARLNQRRQARARLRGRPHRRRARSPPGRARASTSWRAWSRESSRRCARAIGVLERLGAEIVDVSLPSTDHGLATYYIIAPAEASANLARYDGVRYGLSAPATTTCCRTTSRRGEPGSARRSSAASSWAPTRSRPATTTPTTSRPSRSGR